MIHSLWQSTIRGVVQLVLVVVAVLWASIRRVYRSALRIILLAVNAFWCFLVRRAECAEQRLIADLRREIADRKKEHGQDVEDFRRVVKSLNDDILIRDRQIQQLSEVIARDRERVGAETAIAARQKMTAMSDIPRAGDYE